MAGAKNTVNLLSGAQGNIINPNSSPLYQLGRLEVWHWEPREGPRIEVRLVRYISRFHRKSHLKLKNSRL